MQKSPKKPRFSAFSSDCHNLTFAVCIFVRARFYANDIPYNFGDFGPFRGWRRRGRLRHYLAVESVVVPDFRGDFRIFNVLRRIKTLILANFYPTITKILYIVG